VFWEGRGVDVYCARDVPPGKLVRRPEIDDDKTRVVSHLFDHYGGLGRMDHLRTRFFPVRITSETRTGEGNAENGKEQRRNTKGIDHTSISPAATIKRFRSSAILTPGLPPATRSGRFRPNYRFKRCAIDGQSADGTPGGIQGHDRKMLMPRSATSQITALPSSNPRSHSSAQAIRQNSVE